MELHKLPMPDGDHWLMYMRRFTYKADANIEIELFGGPYYELPNKYMRTYKVQFTNITNIEIKLLIEPWIEMKRITSETAGHAKLEYDEGFISVIAEACSIELVDKTTYIGEA